jgi:GNAT superfamily N-acetyltransferase
VIRPLADSERDAALAIVNDAAIAYRGAIPEDRWHDPYMDRAYLDAEINAGVRFFALVDEAQEAATTSAGVGATTPRDGAGIGILGVMGIQDVGDVTLVRHAYVHSRLQRGGVGTALIAHIQSLAPHPMLVGTWAAATWAIAFYQRNGFSLVSPAEKNRLLRTYWDIPQRQTETSVVLADEWALRDIVRPEG